jgi:glycosyltransferase involved in cell wall biosynthesis
VDAVVEAFTDLPGERLVVVGQGPELERLRLRAGANVQLVGAVDDDELRWLYANCVGLVAASYEDFGLTPLEAAAFGKPSAVLRYGGFVDTVRDGETGVFFDAPSSNAVRAAVARLRDGDWDEGILRTHAAGYSEAVFAERLRAVVAEAARGAS